MPNFDTSIFNVQPKSVADYESENQALQSNRLSMLLNQAKLDDHLQSRAEAQQIKTLLRSAPSDKGYAGVAQHLMSQGYADAAQPYQKLADEQLKSQSEAGYKKAQTQTEQLKIVKHHAAGVFANPTIENAVSALMQIQNATGQDESGEIASIQQMTPDQIKMWAAGHSMDADKLLSHFEKIDNGGKVIVNAINPVTGKSNTVSEVAKEQSPESIASNATARRGQNMADARAREANSIQREAQQSQVFEDPNLGPIIINKGTKTAVPATYKDGSPILGKNAFEAQKQGKQLAEAIPMARELIKNATSSGFGAAIDKGAAFIGKSTSGADDAAALQTLSGWMTANVPRMQGPQSDKDVLMYKQMAADIGNPNVPTSRKAAALDTLEKLQKKYADINNGGPAAPAGGDHPSDIQNILNKYKGK